MQKVFRIPVVYERTGTVEVEAESIEEAYELIQDPEFPLPDEDYYVDESFLPAFDKEAFKDLCREETFVDLSGEVRTVCKI